MTKSKKRSETIEEMLRAQIDLNLTQTILQLGLAGVPQQDIRKILKIDILRVNGVLRHLKNKKKNKNPTAL